MGKLNNIKTWMAFILIPPVVFLIVWGPPAALHLMVGLAVFFGLREYCQLVLPDSKGMERLAGIGLGLIPVAMIFFRETAEMTEFAPFCVIVLFLLSVLFMAISKDLSRAVSRMGLTLWGILFIGYLLSYISLIRNMENGVKWVLFLNATVWAGDISALLVGLFFGRHKLYPKISPNKTFEGLGGAIGGSVVVSLVFSQLFLPQLKTEVCILLAVCIAVLGQLGDFTESMLKRSAQAKDSGTLIPGHGGMLDRLDSFLFASPFLYYFLRYFLQEI